MFKSIDGDQMTQVPQSNRVAKRSVLLENWEYYLTESVYHRTFSSEMKTDKSILFYFKNNEGRCKVL